MSYSSMKCARVALITALASLKERLTVLVHHIVDPQKWRLTFRSSAAAGAVLVSQLAIAPATWAADTYWNGDFSFLGFPCGGQFVDVFCWSGFGIPGASDNVFYTDSEPSAFRTVNFKGGTFTSNRAEVTAAGYTWNLGGGLYTLSSDLTVSGANASLAIQGGSVNADSLTVWNGNSEITTGTTSAIGITAGGQINVNGALVLTGGGKATSYYGVVGKAGFDFSNSIEASSATVTGAGSRWDTNTFYTVLEGTGTTTVSNGGEISSVVDTYVGALVGSNGTLNITAGGTVDTNNNGHVAAFSGSRGSVTVGGGGALWNVADNLHVGGDYFGSGGTGTLTVNDGGTVNADSLTVWNGNSEITTGTGGHINVTGALLLTGGGKATSYSGVVDDAASGASNSIGASSVTVTGAGSRWDTRVLYTGLSGAGKTTVSNGGEISSGAVSIGQNGGSKGTLNIATGGTVDTNGDGQLGNFSGSTGSVTVAGSGALWDVANDLHVGRSGGGTGNLTVINGGTVNAGSLTVWNGNSEIDTGTTTTTTDGGQINVNGALLLTGGGKATSYYGAVDTAGYGLSNSIEASTATVTGAGSRWDTSNFLTGRAGTGSTTVSNGGVISSVDDTYVGVLFGSNGTLNIAAGGTVDTNNDGLIAAFSYSRGSVTVGGSGALWNVAGDLQVGGSSGGSGGTGTLRVNAGGTVNADSLEVWNNSSEITTGGGQINVDGLLRLRGGGKATSGIGIVENVGSNLSNSIEASTAIITGAGSRWDTDTFYTGRSGAGTTNVKVGGVISSVFDTHVGGSNGTLNITDGGTVDTNRDGFIAVFGSRGSVTVGGSGALWDVADDLQVGGSNGGSTGTLTVNTGGTVNADSLTVWNGNSEITTGNTATGKEGGQINVNSALLLTGGGKATSYYGVVDNAESNLNNSIEASTATVTGAGSQWDTRVFETGRSGTAATLVSNGGKISSVRDTTVGFRDGSNGTLNITAGGTVDTNDDGRIGIDVGSTGSVTVGGSGARWEVADDLRVGGNNSRSGGTGTLTVNTGGTVSVGDQATVWQNGTLDVAAGEISALGGLVNEGVLTGSGTIVADVSNIKGGSVGPGNSLGRLSIVGDYMQDSLSSITFDVGGILPADANIFAGAYDVLSVTGAASLAGELELSWYSGFTAESGDSFDLFTAESFSGDFDQYTLAALGLGLEWQTEFLIDEFGSTDVLRLSVLSVSEVPIPTAAWLFGSALLGLGAISRRRKGNVGSERSNGIWQDNGNG